MQKHHVLKLSSKVFNGTFNSDKLKNPAAPSYANLSSLSTGAAEFFIFVVLGVPLDFFISRDVSASCISPILHKNLKRMKFSDNQKTIYNECYVAWECDGADGADKS